MASECIVTSSLPDVELPENLTIFDFVCKKFKDYGDRPAITEAHNGRTVTYNELLNMIHRMGSALKRMGFKKNDVFAIYTPNVPEYAVVVLAVTAIGGTVTTINPIYTASELLKQLKLSKAEYLVAYPTNVANAIEAKQKLNMKHTYVFGEAEGLTPFSNLLEDDGSLFELDKTINPYEQVALIPFSSGTTGLPKGVMLTHYSLNSNSAQLMQSEIKLFEIDGPMLAILPWYHIYGYTLIMATGLRYGGHIVTMLRFEPEPFLKCIQEYKIKYANLVPPLYLFLVKHPLVDKYDISSLEQSISGAAPLDKELSQAVKERVGFKVVRQGYGMTELSPASHIMTIAMADIKHGSIGPCLPNTKAKIVDVNSGEALGPNKNGELCVQGPQVMKGYFENPEATAIIMDKGGWLHTGDIGYYDEDKFFYVVDRLKELIKYKGFQVPPAELEALLLTNDKISDAAVIGIPDAEAGELPKAFVVKSSDITEEEVKDFVSSNVAYYKKLRGGVEFVDRIPKSASGKILRRELKEKELSKLNK